MSELKNLYQTALARKSNPQEGSYTSYLYEKGLNKILKKIGEETTEVVVAALSESKEDLIGELNDLAYHLVVLMVEKGITLEEVEEVMAKRSQKQNNLKPERKPIEKI